jgi:hypothetical protein
MTTKVDTYSKEWKDECWNRHLARVKNLKEAKTQTIRKAIFEKIAKDSSYLSAKEAWNAAFPKEQNKKR